MTTVRPRDTRPQAAQNFLRCTFLAIIPSAALFWKIFHNFCTILHNFCTILHNFELFCTIFKVSNWASIFISVFKAEAITIRWNPFWRYIHIFIQLCFHKIFMIRQRTVYKMKKNLVKAEVHRSRKTEIISPHSTLWLS